MSDVFVSYKAEDRKRVKPLVEALQAEGYCVWWDEQIGGGAQWRQMIEAELGTAKCVIVAWSKASVGPNGTFVQDEATRAQERRVYIPVLIEKVHLPLGFGEMQALPLGAWKGDRSDPRYQAILSAVKRIAGDSSGERTSHPAIKTPVSRRAVIGGGAAAAATVGGAGAWLFLKPAAAASSQTIAVLPFANLSGDPAQAYFSDGIAEELRSALGRISGLQVAGRTSSEAVRNDDAATAARKLGVANILSGSVRQSPSTIRVTAELIDSKTGWNRWSEDYDRAPGDSIKIQTDIAENVASALTATLGGAARATLAVGGTSNAAAQDLYLKARAQLHADDSENSMRSAIGLLDSAITLDPGFASAYAVKADTLSDLTGFYTLAGGRFEPGLAEAAGVARQAIALAPRLVAAHMALASILQWQLDIGGAAAEFGKGHSLPGGDVNDLLAYAAFLAILGKPEEALDTARQARVRDPLNVSTFSSEATALVGAERYSEAIPLFRKVLAIAPNRLRDRAGLSGALALMGKYDEAMAENRKLPPNDLFRLVVESVIYSRLGDRAASDAAFRRAQQLFGDSANYQYADIHAQRGETNEAFAALDRAWTFRDPGLAIMKRDKWLGPIRSDPRFDDLLRKMAFPD